MSRGNTDVDTAKLAPEVFCKRLNDYRLEAVLGNLVGYDCLSKPWASATGNTARRSR